MKQHLSKRAGLARGRGGSEVSEKKKITPESHGDDCDCAYCVSEYGYPLVGRVEPVVNNFVFPDAPDNAEVRRLKAEIARLEAEVARLREALKDVWEWFVSNDAESMLRDFLTCNLHEGEPNRYEQIADLRRAAAAVKEGE